MILHFIGDAILRDESLRKLLGQTEEDQKRKIQERLARRKKWKSQGMCMVQII